MAKSIDGAFAEVEDAWSKVRLLPVEGGRFWPVDVRAGAVDAHAGTGAGADGAVSGATGMGVAFVGVPTRRRHVRGVGRGADVGARGRASARCRSRGRWVVGGTDPRKPLDLVVDRELGLGGGFSLGVMMAVTRLCAQMAFAGARDTFRETYEWTLQPARHAAHGGCGRRRGVRAFLEQAAPPGRRRRDLGRPGRCQRGPMIISTSRVRAEAATLPRRPHVLGRHARRLRRKERPRKRQHEDKKSKNAKMAVVGVLYTLKRTPEGLEGPIGKRLYATFESHRALFIWLHHEADKRGYGRKQTSVPRRWLRHHLAAAGAVLRGG